MYSFFQPKDSVQDQQVATKIWTSVATDEARMESEISAMVTTNESQHGRG